MVSSYSVGQVAARVVRLGLVSGSAVEHELHDVVDQPLDFYGGDCDSGAVLRLLHKLGIRYTTHYETFGHGCEHGVEVYREELQLVAGCTRGLLRITDVEWVDDAEGDHVLRFRCNDQPHEWRIEHDDDWQEEQINTQEAFSDGIRALVPRTSPARWCGAFNYDRDGRLDSTWGTQSVFGDPVALRLLGEEFGIEFLSAG